MFRITLMVGTGATPALPTNEEQAGAMRGSVVLIPPRWTVRQAQL